MTKITSSPHTSIDSCIKAKSPLARINGTFPQQTIRPTTHQMPPPNVVYGTHEHQPIGNELSEDSSSDEDEIDQELDRQALLALQPIDLNEPHRSTLFPLNTANFDQNQLPNYSEFIVKLMLVQKGFTLNQACEIMQPKMIERLTLDDCLNLIS